MRDTVNLIGKKIVLNDKTYTINTINFMPTPAQPKNHIWVGLEIQGTFHNYAYEELLPHFKEQIKL